MTLRLPILLAATSQTHALFFLLSVCTLILSVILIEGLVKGRFHGWVRVSRQSSPLFYYLKVVLLVCVIVRLSIFLKELILPS
jgi:hypothetical protein